MGFLLFLTFEAPLLQNVYLVCWFRGVAEKLWGASKECSEMNMENGFSLTLLSLNVV